MLDSMQHEALISRAKPQRATAAHPLSLAYLQVVLAVLLMLTLSFASFWFTGGVRAYVAGESLWSKAQKDAVSHLTRYATSGDERDFAQYAERIGIPLGDRSARLALDQAEPDLAAAREGFLRGGNHPDDVSALIGLYRYCRHYPTFADAVEIWIEADTHIDRLRAVAVQIRESHGLADSAPRLAALVREVDRINRTLTPLEHAFSESIGLAAREVSSIFEAGTALLAALLVAFGILRSRAVLRRVQRAENRLLRTGERLELATNAANDGIWDWNVAARTMFWTPRLRQLLGFDTDEAFAFNFNFRRDLHPDHRDALFASLRHHFIGLHQRLDMQVRLRCRNGSYRWFRLRGMAVRNASGQPQRILGTLSDIHDHMLAIEAQRDAWVQAHQAASDLELALDGANVAMWTYDPSTGRVTHARRWDVLLGRATMPPTFGEWNVLIHPEDLERRSNALQVHIAQRTPHYESEFRMLHANGEWVWVRSRGRVTARGADGEPFECAGVVMNISLQVAAREVQRRQHEPLQAMIDGIDTGIVWSDASRILYANTSLCRMLGFDNKEQLIGRRLWDFVDDDEVAEILERRRKAIEGMDVPLLLGNLRARDGTYVRTVSSLSHVLWNGASHFISTFAPLSEHEKLEMRLQAANARFERVLLSELGAQQAHIARELHDSLGSVLAGLSLMLASTKVSVNAQGKSAELLDQSQEQVRLAAEMTRALARGIMPVGSHPGALMTALEQFAQDLTMIKGVHCEFEAAGDFNDTAPDVGNHVYRIVQEATNNAIRHGRATELHLQLARLADRLTLSVDDNGCGIAPAAPGQTRKGLGFQTMEARAKAIGGSIRIEPSALGGCRVRVAWQHAPSRPGVSAAAELAAAGADSGSAELR